MQTINVGAKPLLLPTMVPSVSSFETHIRADDAINLQKALYEPISLVSAYDVAVSLAKGAEFPLLQSSNNFAESSILMLDSGGYEVSRIRRYVPEGSIKWAFEDYAQICSMLKADLVFSFDYFIEDGESAGDFGIRLVQSMGDHLPFVDKNKLIPVIHLISDGGDKVLSPKEIDDVVSRVCSELKPQFIAIPERELGAGVVAKCTTVRSIVSRLQTTKLHILGCGNPLMFAFLSQAGASLFDGLEWYRTLFASNFHLHHFQHGELFDLLPIDTPVMAWLAEANEHQYPVRTAIRNLNALKAFTIELREALLDGKVANMLAKYFGDRAAQVFEKTSK